MRARSSLPPFSEANVEPAICIGSEKSLRETRRYTPPSYIRETSYYWNGHIVFPERRTIHQRLELTEQCDTLEERSDNTPFDTSPHLLTLHQTSTYKIEK